LGDLTKIQNSQNKGEEKLPVCQVKWQDREPATGFFFFFPLIKIALIIKKKEQVQEGWGTPTKTPEQSEQRRGETTCPSGEMAR
jgi:hypothetical protein